MIMFIVELYKQEELETLLKTIVTKPFETISALFFFSPHFPFKIFKKASKSLLNVCEVMGQIAYWGIALKNIVGNKFRDTQKVVLRRYWYI